MRTTYSTSFSAVDDRFGFGKSGIFWCKYKNETARITAAIAVVIIITVAIWAVSINASANAASLLYTFVFNVLKIATIPCAPLAIGGLTKMIRSGRKYSYKATEEKMLITCPEEDFREDIFYNNVSSITYQNFGDPEKPRGLNVTIYFKDGNESKYCFLFPAYTKVRHPDMTPFRIIEEQAGLLEKPEFLMGKRIDNAGAL